MPTRASSASTTSTSRWTRSRQPVGSFWATRWIFPASERSSGARTPKAISSPCSNPCPPPCEAQQSALFRPEHRRGMPRFSAAFLAPRAAGRCEALHRRGHYLACERMPRLGIGREDRASGCCRLVEDEDTAEMHVLRVEAPRVFESTPGEKRLVLAVGVQLEQSHRRGKHVLVQPQPANGDQQPIGEIAGQLPKLAGDDVCQPRNRRT